MLDPTLSYGLPLNLVGATLGLNTGFSLVHCTAAAIVSENKVLSYPSVVDSIPTKANQEDHVSMSTFAARKARSVVANAQKVIGIEYQCAAQAIDLTDGPLSARRLGAGSGTAYTRFRQNVPPTREDHYQATDMAVAAELTRSGSWSRRPSGRSERYAEGVSLFDLTGRVALLTGSSRGIGLTLARGLADAGATIVLNGVDAGRLERAVADCRARGYQSYGSAFDVTNPDAVGQAIAQIEESVGPIEIVVNNAGVQIRRPLEEFAPQDWNTLMAVNVGGVFLVSQAVARRMIPRGHGKIISIGSMQSELARPSIAPYTASKGAVKNLVKAMCTEWAKYGIQSNGIGPGYFATEMTQALVDNPEFDAWLKNRTPARRWGDVKELIGAVVFLASDASSFVNGHMLYVDGGMLACV